MRHDEKIEQRKVGENWREGRRFGRFENKKVGTTGAGTRAANYWLNLFFYKKCIYSFNFDLKSLIDFSGDEDERERMNMKAEIQRTNQNHNDKFK